MPKAANRVPVEVNQVTGQSSLGDDKAAEVPTARKVNGVWQTGKMPTSAGVLEFIGSLTRQYQLKVDIAPYKDQSITDYNRWWDTFRPEHAPISDWATTLDDEESTLLEYACKLLSWQAFGTLVQQLKLQGTYPSEWNIGAGFQRSTTERLFDRLRINHIVYGGVAKRWPFWWSHARSKEMGPQTTIFGRRYSSNAFYQLRRNLSTGGSSLGSIVGLTDAPDTFAMPLEWIEAAQSGLSPEIEAKLPKDVRKSLRSVGNDLDDAIKQIGNTSLIIGLIAGIGTALLGAPVVGGLLMFLGADAKKLAKSLDNWPDALKKAGNNDAPLNEAAYHILNMLRTTDLKGLFSNKIEDALDLDSKVFMLDLEPDKVQDVERALLTDHYSLAPGSLSPVYFQPMVLLGQEFADAAAQFGTNPFRKGTEEAPDVIAWQRTAMSLWTNWWNDSQPSLDAAFVIDTASLILQQIINLDDMMLALNDLAVGDGLVAMLIRRALDEQGLTRFVDALGGASPVAALRYFFRQLFTDLFMEWFKTKEGVKEADLYPIFCWMNTQAKRDAIEGALGPKIEATAENAGSLYGAITGIKLAAGYPIGEPFAIRGAFLPNVADKNKGALGRALDQFAQYPGDPERAADAISHVELGYLRGWLELARQDCLTGLREALEPDWTTMTSTPYNPNGTHYPDLDDIELPNRGPDLGGGSGNPGRP